MQKNWQDPDFREKQRLAVSEAMKQRWQDPEFRKRQAEAISKGRTLAIRKTVVIEEVKTSREVLTKEEVIVESEPILLDILHLLESRPDLKERLKHILRE